MSPFEILTVSVSIVGALLIPLFVFIVRGAVKWTATEKDVSQLVDEVRNLVDNKNKDHQALSETMDTVVDEQNRVHREIYEQMRMDRDATDKRLRFIEEYWMRKGQVN